ncbi:MAG: ribosomal RNA small subunit methyltransferase A [Phycisphaerae bacterium]|nr:ribosomal RNA small subunit methyltransferase A [Phycisphaerae bacterium]
MQTLSEIRDILSAAGLRPRRSLGQNFLVDANLMGKLLELADLQGGETVLEVGPATGSLTEELLTRAAGVVAVEADRALTEILRQRLGHKENLVILGRDVLAGKHEIAPEVLDALSEVENVQLIANLPYNIAVPLVMNCMVLSWKAVCGATAPICFTRMTFTVQREVAQRLLAGTGSKAYGPVSVLVALLTRATAGRVIPPEAFWPKPKVRSQMLRLDFDAKAAKRLVDMEVLSSVLSATFGHRRKKITSAAKRTDLPFSPQDFLWSLAKAGIDPSVRPEQVSPQEFLTIANTLCDADTH